MPSSFSDILSKYTRQKLINPRKSAQSFQGLANQGSFAAAFSAGLLNAQADRADAQESVLAAALQGEKLALDERRVASNEKLADANSANINKKTSQMDKILQLEEIVKLAQARGLDSRTAEQELQTEYNRQFGGGDRVIKQQAGLAGIRQTDAQTAGIGLSNTIKAGTLSSTVGATNATNQGVINTAVPLAYANLDGKKISNNNQILSGDGQFLDNSLAAGTLGSNIYAKNNQNYALGSTAQAVAENKVENGDITNDAGRLENTFTRQTQGGLIAATNATSGATASTAQPLANLNVERAGLQNIGLGLGNRAAQQGVQFTDATQPSAINATVNTNTGVANTAIPRANETLRTLGLNNGLTQNELTYSANTLGGRTSATNATNQGVTNTAGQRASLTLASLANSVKSGAQGVTLGALKVNYTKATQPQAIATANTTGQVTAQFAKPKAQAQVDNIKAQAKSNAVVAESNQQTSQSKINAQNAQNDAAAREAAALAEAQRIQAQQAAEIARLKTKAGEDVIPAQARAQVAEAEATTENVGRQSSAVTKKAEAEASILEDDSNVSALTVDERVELTRTRAKYADEKENADLFGKRASTAIAIYRAKNDTAFQQQIVTAKTEEQKRRAVNDYVNNTIQVLEASDKAEVREFGLLGKRIQAFDSRQELEAQRDDLNKQMNHLLNKKEEVDATDIIISPLNAFRKYLFPSDSLTGKEREEAIRKGKKVKEVLDFKIKNLEKIGGLK